MAADTAMTKTATTHMIATESLFKASEAVRAGETVPGRCVCPCDHERRTTGDRSAHRM
jgi:hypothetical protein